MKEKLPRGMQIIECELIEFAGKDTIVINKWNDMLWLLGGLTTLFKLKGSLYNISGEVAYIYKLK